MTCPHCLDQGWVHVQHPLKPLGVSMCMTPCPKCNFEGVIPMPEPSPVTYEIITGDSDMNSLWQEGATCPYCQGSVLVRVEPNGMKCPSCGYSIEWIP